MGVKTIKRSDLLGKAQTVQGTILPEHLGITLPHEHLFVDTVTAVRDSKPKDQLGLKLYHQPVTLENLWWLAYHPTSNRDNLILDNEITAIKEVSFFKDAGGGTIVDASNHYMGWSPKGLVRVSRATGLNIIMGSGYYVAETHPAGMNKKTENEIYMEIVREITVGAEHSDIRAGIIGEIGCSWPLTNNEKKVLRAAAKAQQHTGAPLYIHPGRRPVADSSGPLEIISVLKNAGANINCTVICHIERTLSKFDEYIRLLEEGCYLEFDTFGWEGYHSNITVDLPNDHYRVNQIIRLINKGYIDQILISQDICWKHRLRKYGGHGYDHILRNVVQLMRAKGMTEDQITTIIIDNPARMLSFT